METKKHLFTMIMIITYLSCLMSCKDFSVENFFCKECIFITNNNIDSPISKIVYVDMNNSIKTLQPETESSITLEVLQNQLNPILIFYNGEILPHGFLYPYQTKPSINSGFAAHCCYRILNENNAYSILQKKNYLSKVNWNKFMQYLEKFDNPWNLDQDRLINDISTKQLNSKSFVSHRLDR